jgi:hypothetical protein
MRTRLRSATGGASAGESQQQRPERKEADLNTGNESRVSVEHDLDGGSRCDQHERL